MQSHISLTPFENYVFVKDFTDILEESIVSHAINITPGGSLVVTEDSLANNQVSFRLSGAVVNTDYNLEIEITDGKGNKDVYCREVKGVEVLPSAELETNLKQDEIKTIGLNWDTGEEISDLGIANLTVTLKNLSTGLESPLGVSSFGFSGSIISITIDSSVLSPVSYLAKVFITADDNASTYEFQHTINVQS